MDKKIFAQLLVAIIVMFAGIWSYGRAEGGVITICVGTSGTAYLIGDGFKKTSCAKGEQLLSFNIQGPKGEKGDKGDPGLSNWDENRIAALEARVLALEGTPAQCTAVLCENFNSFVDGAIVNQGWVDRENGSLYVVEASEVKEGTKALANQNASSDSIITKTGQSYGNGRQSFYIKTTNRDSWGDYSLGENVSVGLYHDSWDGPSRVVVALKKDGHAAYYDPTLDTFVNFEIYADNAWTLVDIEWRAIDKKARYRINSGQWTDWKIFFGGDAYTTFNTVGLFTKSLGAEKVYFDDLR